MLIISLLMPAIILFYLNTYKKSTYLCNNSFDNWVENCKFIFYSIFFLHSTMNRNALFSLVRNHTQKIWDVIVIGGGATGAGLAFDAASRGFGTLLLEQEDFGKGTSSRSTKLIHGGVRYLAQGDLVLVIEALKERGLILKNAPHLTFNQEFVIPVYTWWEALIYTVGLKFYDILAGRLSLGKSRFIGLGETLKRLPNIRTNGLKGGVIYHDGQFDDSRFLITLIRSVLEKGGVALNYCKVTGLIKDPDGNIAGVIARNVESGQKLRIKARVVINATGVFTDDILIMDQPVMERTIRPSQGIHIVFDKKFLAGESAVMIPKTDDGRVLFAIPWYDKVLIGTTDTPIETISLEPKALEEEITFILNTAGRYLRVPPQRADILSVFAGLRPLAASPYDPTATREISRRHKIRISSSGLVTVEGGKWTIYRRMAQDTIDKIMQAGMLEKRACITRQLTVCGIDHDHQKSDRFHIYGLHAREIKAMFNLNSVNDKPLHPRLPYTRAEIIWICRNEMPRKIEDVLARRTHALLLDARASKEMAPEVATIMAGELEFDKEWIQGQIEAYYKLVDNYICH
jgi:glycerol-3-phosphate dehydrogenase